MYNLHHPEAGRSCVCVTLLMLQATFVHSHLEQLLQKQEASNRCTEILDVDCDFIGLIFHSFGTKFNVLDESFASYWKLFLPTTKQRNAIKFVSS